MIIVDDAHSDKEMLMIKCTVQARSQTTLEDRRESRRQDKSYPTRSLLIGQTLTSLPFSLISHHFHVVDTLRNDLFHPDDDH